MYNNLWVYLLCLAVFLSSQGGPKENQKQFTYLSHISLWFNVHVSHYCFYAFSVCSESSVMSKCTRFLGFTVYHSRNILSCVDVTIYAGRKLRNVGTCRPTCSVHIAHEQEGFLSCHNTGPRFWRTPPNNVSI